MLYDEFLDGIGKESSDSTNYAYKVINELYMKDRLATKEEAYEFYNRNKHSFDWLDNLQIGIAKSIKKPDNLTMIISEEEAKKIINEEFCFEIDKIVICGTPYFEAYDFNWIIFDIKNYPRIYMDGMLYDIYK